ncbi:hypothetical protein G0029_12950 [Acinetobacter sp. YH12138]|uniref:glycosyltransferase family 32 protein n=1 Tax=Acinetobacter sp. YH12138 TaxID=2601122 RepID=UPI0015D16A2E|nr:capsular polysaccharide synthesis protein [Acinetobacter sp. YH12138]QOW50611.1 hypothetical protein G0029_12950 [Acinetobacter sp. YH12138]
MGLRKSIRKIFYHLRFKYLFYKNIRGNCINAENYADPILLGNPKYTQIPKKIWIYWNNNPSKLILDCIDQVKKINTEYEIFFLDDNTIINYCKIDFNVFHELTPQQKSDLIRFDLLYNYGGIWLDASIILYRDLNWILQLCQDNKKECFAFYRKPNTIFFDFPVIENWLLATSAKNNFFKFWRDELSYALTIGVDNYLHNISNLPNPNLYFQKIKNLKYFIAYVACQKVLRKEIPNIYLINCDKNAFLYQNITPKNKYVFLENMTLNYNPSQPPHLIKLIGSQRKNIEHYYNLKKFKKNSLLDFKLNCNN